MAEVLTQLRLDLVDELHTLPESLQSAFPDLAVDFLASVFHGALDKPLARINKSSISQYHQPEPKKRRTLEQPSKEQIEASTAAVDALQQEACCLDSSAVPRPSSFGHLTTSICTTDDSAPNSLISCRRCNKVMFRSVAELHLAQCKEVVVPVESSRPLPSGSTAAYAPSASDLTVKTKRGNGAASNGGGSKGGGKRKRQGGGGKGSKGYSTGNTGSDHWDDIEVELLEPTPLSPTLAAVAGLRQKRTGAGRTKRKELSFVPGRDMRSPIILNSSSSPVAIALLGPATTTTGAGISSSRPVPRPGQKMMALNTTSRHNGGSGSGTNRTDNTKTRANANANVSANGQGSVPAVMLPTGTTDGGSGSGGVLRSTGGLSQVWAHRFTPDQLAAMRVRNPAQFQALQQRFQQHQQMQLQQQQQQQQQRVGMPWLPTSAGILVPGIQAGDGTSTRAAAAGAGGGGDVTRLRPHLIPLHQFQQMQRAAGNGQAQGPGIIVASRSGGVPFQFPPNRQQRSPAGTQLMHQQQQQQLGAHAIATNNGPIGNGTSLNGSGGRWPVPLSSSSPTTNPHFPPVRGSPYLQAMGQQFSVGLQPGMTAAAAAAGQHVVVTRQNAPQLYKQQVEQIVQGVPPHAQHLASIQGVQRQQR